MPETIYCDLVGHIFVSHGMVRLELYEQAPSHGRENVPEQYVMTRRLALPLAGFLRSFPLLEKTVRQLKEQGRAASSSQQNPGEQEHDAS